MGDKRHITFDEAVGLLNEGEYVHTFRGGGSILIGCDHERDSMLKSMKQYENTLQIGGDQCRSMNHGPVLDHTAGSLFIETNKEKLDSFDPIQP